LLDPLEESDAAPRTPITLVSEDCADDMDVRRLDNELLEADEDGSVETDE